MIVSLPVVLTVGFYTYLLSRLPTAVDKAQVLTLTHQPDLLRIPEMIGAVILVALSMGILKNKIPPAQPKAIFAASFGFLPFAVFNQQVITGRSIQPYHYEVLIANYVVLVGVVLSVRLLQPKITRRTALLIASACLLWGTDHYWRLEARPSRVFQKQSRKNDSSRTFIIVEETRIIYANS